MNELSLRISALEANLEAMKRWLVCAQHGHEYFPETCPHCGAEYCYKCCRRTNITKKTVPLITNEQKREHYMICPVCGHDLFEEYKND